MRQHIRSFAFAVMAGLGLGAPASASAVPDKAPHNLQQPRGTSIRKWLGLGGGTASRGRRARPGWSPRQVQRMAAKVRNRARHRRAGRGRRG